MRAARGGRGAAGGARLGLVLAPCLLAATASAPAPTPARFDTVVIDAGHGGEDEGARGARGLTEKDLVLDVSRRLARELRGRGLRVVLTRDRDDFVPLETRTSVANDARADLFVSIHANAAPSPEPRGIETYFVSLEASDAAARRLAERENLAFGAPAGAAAGGEDPLVALLGDMMANEHLHESNEFARLAQNELSEVDPARSRGVKQAPFVVLMGVQMPASLIEIGFLTNHEDEGALLAERHRDRIAKALARAIASFGERFDRRRGAAVEGGG
jgi:N-acetylmuramoyl-L-alanine amidase